MKKVLILGGGFGGIHAAINLANRKDIAVTIIEKNNYHLFTPSLYELALADDVEDNVFLEDLRKTIAIPYSLILNKKNIELIQAEVNLIDIENKLVTTNGGHAFDYDVLIISLGSEASDFGVVGVSDYGFKFKTLDDGLSTYRKLQEIFERYSSQENRSQIHIGVVGGGFTGVELSAEIQIIARRLAKEYGISFDCFKTTLYEAGPVITPFASTKERTVITKRLKSLGIDIVNNVKVAELGPDWISDGTNKFHTDIVIWTAGTQANSLIKQSNLPLNNRGRISVNEYLEVEGLKDVYAIGDAAGAFCPKTKETLPLMAYIANAEGKFIAKRIANGSSKPFDMGHDTWIAPVGGRFAVAHIGSKISFSGLIAWVFREFVDLIYFSKIMPINKALKLFFNRARIFARD